MAPASLEAFERLKGDLPAIRLRVLRDLCAYLLHWNHDGHTDVTGGELALSFGWNLNTVRSRLHELHKKHHLITRSEVSRPSRAKDLGEGHAHGYFTDLPLAAVQRATEAKIAQELAKKGAKGAVR